MRKNLKEQLDDLKEDLGDLKVMVKYLEFDVEATRRERDYYKELAEGKNNGNIPQ